MRAVPVVVMKPAREQSVALLGIEIGASVDPFAESGLDQAFGLAVGARSIGTSEVVMESELDHGSPESMGTIAVAVIGEQTANGDAQRGVVSHSGVKESNRGGSGVGGQD